MIGAEYVAKFLQLIGVENVFLVQGGACAFMVDALARTPGITYTCFQHEQAAAMAADAVWRTTGKLGATFSTSGPGASNLITGIACGYYDSIPAIHITGQVNGKEVAQYRGANVRQAGFQQMDIVTMVKPVCKYAAAVHNLDSLKYELKKATEQAFEGRMGPVLVDIPMDVQTEDAGDGISLPDLSRLARSSVFELETISKRIQSFLNSGKRPLVVFGAGAELAGTNKILEEWLITNNIPFVSSWSALNSFNHSHKLYAGHFGVYGNRGGNYIVQNADTILVIGSRLDNRQRSGNPATFAPNAKIMVLDIDKEELYKYNPQQYDIVCVDLAQLDILLAKINPPSISNEWIDYITEIKGKYFNKDISTSSSRLHSLNPYETITRLNYYLNDDAIMFTDAGANHVWMYQSFYRTKQQSLITSAGHYAMGYSLPAAIGAKLMNRDRQVLSFNGDGGIQMNLQELQTMKEYDLDIKVFVFNNLGLGMIKQFQDSYMGGRHEATGNGMGPGRPNFELIAKAFDMDFTTITYLSDITEAIFKPGRRLIEIVIDEGTLIEPKLEMGRPINDQFPYVSDEEYRHNNKFVVFEHKR